MGRLIEVSDELFSDALNIADQQSVDPGNVVEHWARVGKAVIEAANVPTANQASQGSIELVDVIRRMKQLMNEKPVRGVDIKKLIDDGRS